MAAITPLRVGIAGLGTVGAGSLNILQTNGAMIASRAGRPITVTAVSMRDAAKKRDCSLENIAVETDATALVARDDVDVIIEAIGGHEGVARRVVENALSSGKHVVTANKALIAHHGLALAERAESRSVTLAYEAAVAGGIPVISALRSGLGANKIQKISGILNGTCNYILSRMYHEQLSAESVTAEAAKLGYLEADPALDIDGIDASHKLSILASLAFGTQVDLAGVRTEGIRGVTLRDMRYADAFGYRIKLLGVATFDDAGLMQSVHPALVEKSLPLASVDSSFNAVQIEGDAVGSVMLEGRGAGAGPTGSAIVADIIAIARGDRWPVFHVPATELLRANHGDANKATSCYYLRLSVKDEPGVLADVTRAFAAGGISVRAITQHEITDDGAAQVVVITHQTSAGAMQAAYASIAALPASISAPVLMRMEG